MALPVWPANSATTPQMSLKAMTLPSPAAVPPIGVVCEATADKAQAGLVAERAQAVLLRADEVALDDVAGGQDEERYPSVGRDDVAGGRARPADEVVMRADRMMASSSLL